MPKHRRRRLSRNRRTKKRWQYIQAYKLWLREDGQWEAIGAILGDSLGVVEPFHFSKEGAIFTITDGSQPWTPGDQ